MIGQILPDVNFSCEIDSFYIDTGNQSYTCLVNFYDESTGNPTEWQWMLGNGLSSSYQHPQNVPYWHWGLNDTINTSCYSVWLYATNTYGSDSLQCNNYICVNSNGCYCPTDTFITTDINSNNEQTLNPYYQIYANSITFFYPQSSDSERSLIIYTLTGSIVFEKYNIPNTEIVIDRNFLKSGVYIALFRNGKITLATRKFVIN